MLAPFVNGDSPALRQPRRAETTPRDGHAYISATADGCGFSPQFVAHRPGSINTQFVTDHDALDGIGKHSAERAAAYAHGHHTVAGRHALDGSIKLVGAGRALKARSVQAQRTSRHRERSHRQDETAREIGGRGTALAAHRGVPDAVRGGREPATRQPAGALRTAGFEALLTDGYGELLACGQHR